jgi:hypothetical protein
MSIAYTPAMMGNSSRARVGSVMRQGLSGLKRNKNPRRTGTAGVQDIRVSHAYGRQFSVLGVAISNAVAVFT